MLEISIPELKEDSKNLKDIVFNILTQEQDLTLMKIFNKIRATYNVSASYQGVRKAVEYLVEKKILIKKDRKYSLNKDWLLKYKKFFDDLLAKEVSNYKPKFSIELTKGNYSVYRFSNLLELDVFWGDLLMYLPHHLDPDEPKIAIMMPKYCWWMLINLGRETKVYEEYKKMNLKFVFTIENPLNKWAAEIYKDIADEVIFLKEKNPELSDIDIIGDNIIKVEYSKKITDKIKRFFNKYKTTQEMSMKEITEIAHTKCDIRLIIFKDKTFAESIRKSYGQSL